MIGKIVSFGFDLATLPARVTYRGAKALLAAPGDLDLLMAELRQASADVAREVQGLMDQVDAEMRQKASHLSSEQKEQAAALALSAAEQHLSMAAVNMLRALWLAVDSNRSLSDSQSGGVVIEQERHSPSPGRR